MQKNWFERNPKKTLGGTILFGFGFVLLVAELGCRLFVPGWTPGNMERVDFWRYDRLLGWAHKPGQKGCFIHRDFSVEIYINSDGLRDKDYLLERTDKFEGKQLGKDQEIRAIGNGLFNQARNVLGKVIKAVYDTGLEASS